MKQNLFLFNGYPTQLPYLVDEQDYVLLNDTSTHTVCSYCGQEVTNHPFCIAKEAFEMYAGKLFLTLLLLFFLGYCWIKRRIKKRKEDELNL